MTDDQLTIIRFIESEYDIDNIINQNIGVLSESELLEETQVLIDKMIEEIGLTLKMTKSEAAALYNEYTEIMMNVTTMLLMRD